jgi:hypothetical protein
MSIRIKITEEEILSKPNDSELGSYIRYKYLVQKDSLKQEKDILSLGQIPDDEPERCLVCGEFTPYTKGTHVDFRVGYIRGAGQGCYKPIKCPKNA